MYNMYISLANCGKGQLFLAFTQWMVFVKAICSRHNTTLSPSGYFNLL